VQLPILPVQGTDAEPDQGMIQRLDVVPDNVGGGDAHREERRDDKTPPSKAVATLHHGQ